MIAEEKLKEAPMISDKEIWKAIIYAESHGRGVKIKAKDIDPIVFASCRVSSEAQREADIKYYEGKQIVGD